jgi:hypothetical protein
VSVDAVLAELSNEAGKELAANWDRLLRPDPVTLKYREGREVSNEVGRELIDKGLAALVPGHLHYEGALECILTTLGRRARLALLELIVAERATGRFR